MLEAASLADFAEQAQASGMVYWMGTCCYDCTQALYKRKREQYPSHYGDKRTAKYMQDISQGRKCADCIGLIKGAVWSSFGATESRYASNGCPDRGADGMLAYCKSKNAAWGGIDTLPERRGLFLHKIGHCGVYIGDGWAIEAKGFADGVVRTRVEGRGWTEWAELPFLRYDRAAEDEETAPVKTQWRGKVKTKTGGGVSLWHSPRKDVALLHIPESTIVPVLETRQNAMLLAKYGGMTGYIDGQYLIDVDEGVTTTGDVNIVVPGLTRDEADALLSIYTRAYELPPVGLTVRG